MVEQNRNQYKPSVVTHPGETLKDALGALGMTQSEFADRTGLARKTVSEIITGRNRITPDTALLLERTLRVPAHFWLNRERDYRESLARAEERDRLKDNITWLSNFPLRKAFRMGWIRKQKDPIEQLREVLNFFGMGSPELWEEHWHGISVEWRQATSYEINIYARALWLRQGELEAQKVLTDPYNASRFQDALRMIRKNISNNHDSFEPIIRDECCRAGVAVVFVPEISGARAYGATRWLTPEKAILQMSLRGKSDYHFWFTFFHEAFHILSGKKRTTFIESTGKLQTEQDDDEKRADTFAANFLIPKKEWIKFQYNPSFTREPIESFSKAIGITPGIVVGRLQHDSLIEYKSYLNDLKAKFDFKPTTTKT